ncbi:hypothetical protein Tco_0528384 [Tanacetum coccineum]
MDKGFLNRKTTSKKVVDNDLVVTGSVLGDLAGKVKNIDGGDVRLADDVVEQAPHTGERLILADQQVCKDREAVNRPDLGPRNTIGSHSSKNISKSYLTEHVSCVPLWELENMHYVPIVAYSKFGGRSESMQEPFVWEVSAEVPLVDSVDLDNPSRGMGKGYTDEHGALDELRNFVNQKAEEESLIEFIGNNTNDGCTLRGKQDDKISSKKPSSSLEVINEDSDTDVDEVLLPDIGTSFPSSSFGGGQSLEKELNAYDDDYEDQFEEYPSSYEEFCDQFDFKVKGQGRN